MKNSGEVRVETRITIPYSMGRQRRGHRSRRGEVVLEASMAEGSPVTMRDAHVRLPECAAVKQDAPHYRTWVSLLDLGRHAAGQDAESPDEWTRKADGIMRRVIKGDSAASAILLDFVFSDLGIPPGTMVPRAGEGEKS